MPSDREKPTITDPENHRWRTGRKVGRTIYAEQWPREEHDLDEDPLIGVMDTPALAAEAVRSHNLDPMMPSDPTAPAQPLLCPERKWSGGNSEKGATFLMDMGTGRCSLCGWPPDVHVRALGPSDPTEEQKARHRARAEHYSALSRRGDPEHRCNATEEDFDAGWLAARASDAPPNEEALAAVNYLEHTIRRHAVIRDVQAGEWVARHLRTLREALAAPSPGVRTLRHPDGSLRYPEGYDPADDIAAGRQPLHEYSPTGPPNARERYVPIDEGGGNERCEHCFERGSAHRCPVPPVLPREDAA